MSLLGYHTATPLELRTQKGSGLQGVATQACRQSTSHYVPPQTCVVRRTDEKNWSFIAAGRYGQHMLKGERPPGRLGLRLMDEDDPGRPEEYCGCRYGKAPHTESDKEPWAGSRGT